MKKIIISMLAVFTLICSYIQPAAADKLLIRVEASKKLITPGSELILTVSIKNAENIGAIQYTFNFDSNMLEYKGYTYGNTAKNNANAISVTKANESNLGFAAIFVNKPLNGDEELCSFKFTVKDTAVDGRINYSVLNEKIGTGVVDAVALPEGSITYDTVTVSAHKAAAIYYGADGIIEISVNDSLLEEGNTIAVGLYQDSGNSERLYGVHLFVYPRDTESGVIKTDISDKADSFNKIKLMLFEDMRAIKPIGRAETIAINSGNAV